MIDYYDEYYDDYDDMFDSFDIDHLWPYDEFEAHDVLLPRHQSMVRSHITQHSAGLYDLRRGPNRQHTNSRAKKPKWRRDRTQERRFKHGGWAQSGGQSRAS